MNKKLFSALAAVAICMTAAPASASLIYDIYDTTDDVAIGHIEFATDGLITSPSDVVDFEFSTENGATYTESDIISIQVLVDDDNWQLCWGAVSADISPGFCDSADDVITDSALTAVKTSVQFLHLYADPFDPVEPAPNFADAFETLNYEGLMRFDPRHVPEPTIPALLGIGLAGMVFARKRMKRVAQSNA